MLMATAESPATISAESAHPSYSISEPLPPSLIFFISNVHNLIPIKLDLYNYNLWKIQCEGALKASSLFEHVQESDAPSSTITDATGNSIPNPLYPKWALADAFVRSCLISTFTPALLVQVENCHTVPDLWKFLEQKFTPESNAVFNLRLKLSSLQKLPNQSVGDFLQELREIADQLADAGTPVSKTELFDHSIRGLPPEFDSIKPILRGFSLDSEIQDIHNRIIFECSKLESKSLPFTGFSSQMAKETSGGFHLSSGKFDSGNHENTCSLQLKLYTLEKLHNQSVGDFLQEMRKIADQLSSAGSPVGTDELVYHSLRGLSPEFASIKPVIRSISLNTEIQEIHNRIILECSKLETKSQMAKETCGGSQLSPGKFVSGNDQHSGNQSGATPSQCTGAPSQPTSMEPFLPAKSFDTTALASWSPANAISHLPSGLNSNKGFGVSTNKEYSGIAGFGISSVAPGVQREIEKERNRKEISLEGTGREHRHLADKEVSLEAMSGKETGFPRAEGRLGFAGFAASTTGATISNEPKLGVMDQANSRLLKDRVALSFEERIVLSLEERRHHQAPQGSGSLQRLPFQGFQGSSGPQISQAKPETNANLSGSKRKTLSPPTNGASYLSSYVSKKNVKHWNCAICFINFPDIALEQHLRSKRHKAAELSKGKNVDPAGIVDVKILSSQKKELEGQVCKVKQNDDFPSGKAENGVVDGKLQGAKHGMCQIGTDIEQVMDERKEQLQEPKENGHSFFDAKLKESPSTIFNLRLKLVSLQKLPNQSVGDFLQELRNIANQLADAGSPVRKVELFYHSLRGLPPEFDSIKPVVRSLSLNSDIEDIHNRIVSECSGIKSKSCESTRFVSQLAKETSNDFQLNSSKFGSENDQHSGNQSRVTPSQSSGAPPPPPPPPISVETFRPAKSFNATTSASWSTSNQWNANSHLPSGLNSNKGFGVSPNKESWGLCGITDGSSVSTAITGFGIGPIAHGVPQETGKQTSFQGFAGFSASTTGPTILNEPKLLVPDQANSGFLKDSVALSLEEKMAYQTPKGSGSLQRLPFQGFQGSSGPQISQAKPDANLFGSRRSQTLSPPTGGASYLSPYVSKKNRKFWTCAICHISVPRHGKALEKHLRSRTHKAWELCIGKTAELAGVADAKQNDVSPVTSAENGVRRMTWHRAKDKKSFKFWCDLCEIGTDIEKVMDDHKDGSEHKKRLKEAPEKEREPEFVAKDDARETQDMDGVGGAGNGDAVENHLVDNEKVMDAHNNGKKHEGLVQEPKENDQSVTTVEVPEGP